MSSPLVSCLITSYNAKDYVAEAISSVLNQTYKNIELIVVDDCSTDGTEEVIEQFLDDTRMTFIRHKKNSGLPAVSRNTGLDLAKGEYIAFLDADDYWITDKLEKQLAEFNQPDVIGVSSNAHHIKESSMLKGETFSGWVDFTFADFLSGNRVYLSSLIIKNIGARFDTSWNLRFVEDRDFLMSIVYSENAKILKHHEHLIYYRIHGLGGSRVLDNQLNSLNIIAKYEGKIKDIDIKTFRFHVLVRVLTECVKGEIVDMSKYINECKTNAQSLKQKSIAFAFQTISIMPLSIRRFALKLYFK